jgi:hypothetical protein
MITGAVLAAQAWRSVCVHMVLVCQSNVQSLLQGGVSATWLPSSTYTLWLSCSKGCCTCREEGEVSQRLAPAITAAAEGLARLSAHLDAVAFREVCCHQHLPAVVHCSKCRKLPFFHAACIFS